MIPPILGESLKAQYNLTFLHIDGSLGESPKAQCLYLIVISNILLVDKWYLYDPIS